MIPIYCGNNRNDPDLVNNRKRIGSKHECLRKGIGVGKNLPYDPSYSVHYIPIDSTRYYCGTKRRNPHRYHRMGSPAVCLRIGVGIGKKLKFKEVEQKHESKEPKESKESKENQGQFSFN